MSIAVDANNRVVGATYDGAGNTTAVNGTTMTWDAQGRMATAGSDTYSYNPSNQRVYKNGKLFVRGIDGKVVAVYNTSGGLTLSDAWEYFRGRKVGQKEDRLGTVQNGSRFYPYGEEHPATAQDKDKFATYWRDSTGFDYAMNRYYMSAHGRFLSPDPYPGSASAGRSGSWNRYSYTENNPSNAIDPNGLCDTSSIACLRNQQEAEREAGTEETYSSGSGTACTMYAGMFTCSTTYVDDQGEKYSASSSAREITSAQTQSKATTYLAKAVNVAATALDTYSDCRELFSTDEGRRSSNWNPKSFLTQLYDGRPHYISEPSWFISRFGAYQSALTSVLPNSIYGVAIPYYSSFFSPIGIGSSLFVAAGVLINANLLIYHGDRGEHSENADTLIHEMGHVYDIMSLLGSGGSRLSSLPEDAGYNFSLTHRACHFPIP
jgi:RHS repeat-associated protein